MAVLTHEQKRFLVVRFACFDTPLRAANALKAEFGVEITRTQASKYNPDSVYDAVRGTPKKPKPIAREWAETYADSRKRFLDEVNDVPIAHKAVRMRELQALLDRNRERNPVVVLDTLEQAAKEMGDFFTNRRVLTPEDPAEALARELGLSAEELRAAVMPDQPSGADGARGGDDGRDG